MDQLCFEMTSNIVSFLRDLANFLMQPIPLIFCCLGFLLLVAKLIKTLIS